MLAYLGSFSFSLIPIVITIIFIVVLLWFLIEVIRWLRRH